MSGRKPDKLLQASSYFLPIHRCVCACMIVNVRLKVSRAGKYESCAARIRARHRANRVMVEREHNQKLNSYGKPFPNLILQGS